MRDAVIFPAQTLLQVCGHLAGKELLPRQTVADDEPDGILHPDLSEVKGQPHAKRALEIAAAGRHSILILCPSKPSRRLSSSVGLRPNAVTRSTGQRVAVATAAS